MSDHPPMPTEVLDKIGTMVLLLDAQGRVRQVNRACRRTFGYNLSELHDQPFWSLLPIPAEAEQLREQFDAVRRSGRPCRGEGLWRTRTGEQRCVAWSAECIDPPGPGAARLVATVVDITEHRRAEAALAESEALHRITLGSISDAVFITTDQGELTFICPNVAVIFGYSYEQTRQLGNIRRLLGDDLPEPVLVHQQGEVQNLERQIHDHAGRLHHLLVNVKHVEIHGGTLLYTCRDVTARKLAEESVRAYQAELAHATRLSMLGEMAAGLAHELNQPLSAIANFARAGVNTLKAGRADPAELSNDLDQIAQQAHRAGEIIRRLRQLVRKQKPRRSRVDLAQLVRESWTLLAPAARTHGEALELLCDTPAPCVLADPIGLQQVLINLMRNGLDAMSSTGNPAGTLRVAITPTSEPGWQIAVTDTGPGFSPDAAERVFEPFFTTKPQGLGLGLSISRSIIEQHAGRMWAEPAPHGGATFAFTLPDY